ncbi:MAG: 2-hydroxy-3-oxopropionate reductase [Firmicutes bacterium]|jgi:2-hydroxy-3-oxopropionate reductase|nr:2-hydroxy-3-oxopropionate reductase [Bacillota bacterium]
MKKIGFVGLGVMGLPMCRNLIKAGYDVTVFDVRHEAVDAIAADGARRGASSADVASRTEVILTMLPDSPQVREVVLGPSGVLEGARPGSIIVDMSSIAPSTSKEVAQEARKLGVRMIDAPVSGGQPGAEAGTLAFMVGGEQRDFDECHDILKTMGSSVVRVGDIGAGNAVKLCNQIVVALNIAAVGEAFVLGTKAGVDPAMIFEAIRGGLAGSTVMDAKIPLVLERNFEPGFRIDLHYKDLANALQTGKDVKAPLPLTGLMAQILESLRVEGKGSLDHGAIMTFFEQLADTEIRS